MVASRIASNSIALTSHAGLDPEFGKRIIKEVVGQGISRGGGELEGMRRHRRDIF